jgi:3-dehydroquinate synthase
MNATIEDAGGSPDGRTVTSLPVALGDRGYDILIGPHLLARAGELIAARLPKRRLAVVTDSTVAGLHLQTLLDSLSGAGCPVLEPVTVPAGESSKGMETLADLLDRLLVQGIDRRTVLVALGGGIVGDLAGFAAAILLRGVDFIQIPTTLLAQVDSSVGGKTGVNCRHGKNLIGAFHQPRLVLADTGVLDTLPHRELLAGYAEVLKYGLIDRPEFFDWLEVNGAAVIQGESTARAEAIKVSCRSKADIVARDERESGLRELLNLGHTFGHALEAEAGYSGALIHGEAVAIGMVMAFDLSVRLGLCPAADAERVRRHLTAVGLPVSPQSLPQAVPDGVWTADRLLSHMAKDKKVRDGHLTFVLARGIGRSFLARDVPADPVRDLLQAALEGEPN